MSNLEKYTTLHSYVTRIAEDDLTNDQTPAASVAYSVGQVMQSMGTTIQEAALRIHHCTDKEVVDNFYAGISMVAEQLNQVGTEIGAMVAPFAELAEELPANPEDQLRAQVCMFNDNTVPVLLSEAQMFLGEHLRGNQ